MYKKCEHRNDHMSVCASIRVSVYLCARPYVHPPCGSHKSLQILQPTDLSPILDHSPPTHTHVHTHSPIPFPLSWESEITQTP